MISIVLRESVRHYFSYGGDCSTSAKANLTELIRLDVSRLLAYAASYPNNRLIFHASDMIIEVQTEASYLSRSIPGWIAYLGERDDVKPNAPKLASEFTLPLPLVAT